MKYTHTTHLSNGTPFTVEIDIDEKGLGDFLAGRAIVTKSGVSKVQDGLITARVTDGLAARVLLKQDKEWRVARRVAEDRIKQRLHDEGLSPRFGSPSYDEFFARRNAEMKVWEQENPRPFSVPWTGAK